MSDSPQLNPSSFSPMLPRFDVEMAATLNERAKILGVGVSAIDMKRALAQVVAAIESRRKGYICATGVHGIMESQNNPALAQILNRALLNLPDGRPTMWVGRLQNLSGMQQVTGPDFMLAVSAMSVARGYTHFLYGGAPGVAESLKQELTQKFPGLRVIGTYTPPFRPLQTEEEEDLQTLIARLRPDVFWVGLSTPKQELFMAKYLHRLDTTLMVGVGAAFDLHTHRIKDAPDWIKKSGMQWLHRLCQEPRRLWKRYLINNPKFLYKISLQFVGAHKVQTQRSQTQTSRPHLISEQLTPPQSFVTLSVDDGHPTDLRTLELVQKYGLKATFYVPAKFERPVMTRSQLQLLSRHAELGGHTMNHLRLTSLPEAQVWAELSDGKKWLEDVSGSRVDSFCYPGGKFNQRVATLAEKAGYLGARTCMLNLTGFPAKPFAWGVSTHAYSHGRVVQLRHALLEGNLEGGWKFFRTFKGLVDWEEQFLCTLDYVSRSGGIAHLFLHSWEIDERNEWGKLERVFQAISRYELPMRMTNGELYRLWHTRNRGDFATARAEQVQPQAKAS